MPRERLIIMLVHVLEAILSLLIAVHCNLLECYRICWVYCVFLIVFLSFTYLFNAKLADAVCYRLVMVDWGGLHLFCRNDESGFSMLIFTRVFKGWCVLRLSIILLNNRYTVMTTIKFATLAERIFIKRIPLQVPLRIQTFIHFIIADMLYLKVFVVLNFYIMYWLRGTDRN